MISIRCSCKNTIKYFIGWVDLTYSYKPKKHSVYDFEYSIFCCKDCKEFLKKGMAMAVIEIPININASSKKEFIKKASIQIKNNSDIVIPKKFIIEATEDLISYKESPLVELLRIYKSKNEKNKKSYPTKPIWELSRFIIKRREAINIMNNMNVDYDLDKIERSAKKYFNKYYSLYALGK